MAAQFRARVLRQRRPFGSAQVFELSLDFAQGWPEGANAEAHEDGLHLVHDPRLLGDKILPLAVRSPRVLLLDLVRLLARVLGVGIETADMLVNEVLSRRWRDHKAIARYAGLTGSPDESGKRRRERGLARAGSARVRCGMIQFAWRFVSFQKGSALAQWFAARTADRRASTRKTMIV